MPTSDEFRRNITFSKHLDILELVERDAENEERSISAIVVRALVSYYAQRKQEAELFNQRQSTSNGKAPPPVFETPTPDQIAAARSAKIREQHGQEKS